MVFCMFFGFVFQNSDLDFMGGLYGQVINDWLEGVLGSCGNWIFIFFFAIGSVILLFNPSLSWVVNFFNKLSNGYLKRKSMKMDFQMFLLQMISHPKIMKKKIKMIPHH